MIRSPAFSAFALVALLCVAFARCSASTGSSRGVNSPNAAGNGPSVVVGPATKDTQNVFLPAVRVITTIIDGETVQNQECSGALVDPGTVVTAGHCVCRPREPTSSDNFLTRALALKGVTVTDITDSRSACGTVSIVATLVYGKPGEKPEPGRYFGKVLVHPDIKLIGGASEGKSQVVSNNADLAVIRLYEPVSQNVAPFVLTDSEVKVDDALVVIGYGPTGSGDQYGARRSGGNRVTKIIRNPTGNVIFGADAPPSPDGGVPAHVRPGDSGGACVSDENPNVLIGIITMGEQSDAGNEISYCTSIYPYEGWLSQFIRRDGPAADAGQDPSPQPATR